MSVPPITRDVYLEEVRLQQKRRGGHDFVGVEGVVGVGVGGFGLRGVKEEAGFLGRGEGIRLGSCDL